MYLHISVGAGVVGPVLSVEVAIWWFGFAITRVQTLESMLKFRSWSPVCPSGFGVELVKM